MKAYSYTARSEAGATVDGIVEALTRDDAIESLRSSGLIVQDIEESTGAHDVDLRLGGRRTKEKSLSIMCNQLSIILDSGMPIVRTLQLVAAQSDDKTLKSILGDVADDVAAGHGLADSFERHGSGLPSTFVETVRAGEASGNLGVVFRRLADYFKRSSQTKSKVKSAMIYPCFVLGVALVVVIIIMVVAVPVFETTFASMGSELPWITRFVIDTSNFWTNNFLIVAGIVIALVIAIKLAKRNDDFHMRWSRLGTHVPVVGRITRMGSASQYAGTMSVMMEAGLSVVRSIENYWMACKLASIQPDLEAGRPLADSLTKTEAYPDLVCEMSGVGEQTGTLEHTLQVLSEYYDNEVETSTSRALSILEPVIIVILAVIVCTLLLAVYLPIFQIYGGVTG